jgi:phosphatidate phosphatase APP1
VLITKRVTDDRSSEPLIDQFAYKTQKIEDILARLPLVRFVLVGDDGERDPEVYDWVRARHPDRIEAIWIRRVHPDAKRPRIAGQRDLTDVLREAAAMAAR